MIRGPRRQQTKYTMFRFKSNAEIKNGTDPTSQPALSRSAGTLRCMEPPRTAQFSSLMPTPSLAFVSLPAAPLLGIYQRAIGNKFLTGIYVAVMAIYKAKRH